MDEDLLRLRREAEREPDTPASWLALGAALTRAGQRGDALDALYRAALLGGDPEQVQPALATNGAYASPWAELDADPQASRRAPVTGPRRGEVVAQGGGAPAFVVIDRGGVVLHPTCARFDGRTLGVAPHPKGSRDRVRHSPGAGPTGTFGVAERTERYGEARHQKRTRYVVASLDRPVHVPPEQEPRSSYIRPTVDLAGRVHAYGYVLGPDLRPLLERPPPPPGFFPGGIGCVSVARDLRMAALWRDSLSTALGLLDPAGAITFTRTLRARVPRPVFDDRGRALVLSGDALEALDPAGRVEWSVRASWSGDLALGDGDAVYLLSGGLHRIVDGRVEWSVQVDRPIDPPVVDRHGVVYVSTIRDPDKTYRLIAVGPDGVRLFTVEGQHRPLAIDALGRLLATRAGGGVVAIA